MKRGFIFVLDGVIVNTQPQHFRAWRKLATELGFTLSEAKGDTLRGVSRVAALEIVLESGGLTFSDEEKTSLADRKNTYYREFISGLTAGDILPGVKGFLSALRKDKMGIALATVSKNAGTILEALDLVTAFDFMVDGTMIQKGKPDPEVFLKACAGLGRRPSECVVFEDALAGIQGAAAAGMLSVGVGAGNLKGIADFYIDSFENIGSIYRLFR